MEPKLFLPQAETIHLEGSESDPEVAEIVSQFIIPIATCALKGYNTEDHHLDANWEFSDPTEVR